MLDLRNKILTVKWAIPISNKLRGFYNFWGRSKLLKYSVLQPSTAQFFPVQENLQGKVLPQVPLVLQILGQLGCMHASVIVISTLVWLAQDSMNIEITRACALG